MVQDLNGTFTLARTIAFGVSILFAFLVLALAGAITNYTTTFFLGAYFQFAALGIATAVLTLLTLPLALFLSLNRKGAITSMIAIEFGWTFFLWIMWLATGATAASASWQGDCGLFLSSRTQAACRETQAVTAFSFLTWIVLLAYNVTLLVLVVRQQMRGNTGVWAGFVTETDYSAPGATSNAAPQQEPKYADASPAIPSQYPPQMQSPQVGGYPQV